MYRYVGQVWSTWARTVAARASRASSPDSVRTQQRRLRGVSVSGRVFVLCAGGWQPAALGMLPTFPGPSRL